MRYLLLWLMVSGCATIGSLQRADTVGKGRIQLGMEASAWGVSSAVGGVNIPHTAISGRYGVAEAVDVGVRVGFGGAEVLTKFQLTPPEQEKFVVSIAPSFGGFALGTSEGGAGILSTQVPVLLGVGIQKHQLVLAPKLHVWSFLASSDTSSAAAHIVSPGASAGFAIAVGERLHILPEVAWVFPAFVLGGTSETTTELFGTDEFGSIHQFSVAFLFDLG